MANQDNGKTFVDTLVEAQKSAVDTMVENTRRFANGNTAVTEAAEKGAEWYKNLVETSKATVDTATEQLSKATEGTQSTASTSTQFFQNWMQQQMDTAKRMWDTTTGSMQGWMSNAQAQQSQNPMAAAMQQWNNMMSSWTAMTNGMSAMNNGAAAFQNPFNMDAWKTAAQSWNTLFNQWYETLNTAAADMQKTLEHGTLQDAYRNMVNTADGYTRFYEMWMPMWKSISEKTFNTEVYRQWMNPSQYKELMDRYFGFMPEGARTYLQQMTAAAQDSLKQMGTTGTAAYSQMRAAMGAVMPTGMGADMFGNMLNGYNNLYGQLQNAVSPMMRMMTPNASTRGMQEWSDILNRLTQWSIKNAELQYMVYNQGTKVMDRLAENVAAKVQSGEEVKSMMVLYQEWLNLSDKTFVELFESDAYSTLMAETSGMQLRLKKDVETQMEKAMVNIPVATRSELDELYKSIYDLKKQVRTLERAAADSNDAPAPAPAPSAGPGALSPEANAENAAKAGKNGKR